MLAFKPLFQRDFSGGVPAWQRSGMPNRGGPGQAETGSVSAQSIQATLTMAYERLQASVQSRFPAVNAPNAPEDTSAAETEYSPQAVADRIVGFVADRLAQEKANGASQERLQSLYQQGLKGIERGLREGRDIIAGQNMFSGTTKDTFYETVNLIADGMQALGEELFGVELDAPTQPAPVAGNGFQASRSQVMLESSRSFEMEVVTQEGDRVKILVNSGQSFSSDQFKYQDGNRSIDAFEINMSSFDNLSFSVEGDLNESELAALNELFSQVNDVAETFYGGDVELAFDQAMNVGMNPEQLASFAVNMNQTDTIAVRDTYVAVQNMAGPARMNPYQDMFARLGDFAKQANDGAGKLAALPQAPSNWQSLYADLIGRLHSDRGQSRGYGDAFQRFANRLAG